MNNRIIKVILCILFVAIVILICSSNIYAMDLSEFTPSKGDASNEDYLKALPTTNLKALGPTAHHNRSFIGETFQGYTSEFCIETDTNNEKYKEIKVLVENLTKDCTTEKEKAAAICTWVYQNVKYTYGLTANAEIESVYRFFELKQGNCEVYTLLTNYMLYLCNIPTATATSMTHMWIIAYVDGNWIYMDPTGGITGGTTGKTLEVTFAYDGLVYAIANPDEGAYVTGIAKSKEEIESLENFTIPENSYMKGIYNTAFNGKYEVRAKLDTLGAKYIEENKTCTWTNNGYISGKREHTIEQIPEGQYIIHQCKYCGKIEAKIFNPNAGSETKPTTPSYKLGDANQDGVIDALDAREVLKYCVGKVNFTANQKLAADVNKDGVADALDSREILKYCVGKITKF